MNRRTLVLVAIAVAVGAASLGLYLAGIASGSSIVQFAGLMVGATTFVPLPADTFVLSASANNSAVVIGVVGGLINGTMVLAERTWILLLVDHPAFNRFKAFFSANRFVTWTERNMFVALIVGGASFIPFEPFRLIAVMNGYSVPKYFLATCLARGGRYYVLASVGAALLQVGLLRQAIWITLLLFAFGLWRSGVNLIRGSRAVDLSDGKVDEVDSDGCCDC